MKTLPQVRMELIFNEWMRQYAADPLKFSPLLDSEGNAFEDYGEQATRQFHLIADEMDAAGLLPKPIEQQ